MTTTATTNPATQSQAPQDRRAWHGAGFPAQVAVLTGRSVRALLKDPATVIFVMLQPLIMITLFSQAFGKTLASSVAAQGGSYINYLVPAMLVSTGIGAALQSGLGLITDMKSGILARFRSLPIRQGSVLFGRSLAYLVRTGSQMMVLLVASTVLFGFDPAGGLLGTAGAVLMSLLVSWTLIWVFLAIASWVRKQEVMQSLGYAAMFPLMFASSAFVPTESLSSWLRVVATLNPLTYAINASRELTLATPVGANVLAAVATNALLCAIAIVVALKGFRRPL